MADQGVSEILEAALSAVLEEEVKEFCTEVLQVRPYNLFVKLHQFAALGDPLGLDDQNQGVDRAALLAQLKGQMQYLAINLATLFVG